MCMPWPYTRGGERVGASDEFQFAVTNGDKNVFTRREGLQCALRGVLTFASVPVLAPPSGLAVNPPPPMPFSSCLARHGGNVGVSVGAFDGNSPILNLSGGGDACYNFSGVVRTVRLQGVTWQGKRTLYRCDGNHHNDADHKGACVFGGAFICPDMTPALEWEKLYQSKNSPTGAVVLRECKVEDLLLEAPRIHGCFDGFQNGSGTRTTCRDVELRKWAMTMVRDDAFENDNWWPNLMVEDSLVDGAFCVFSCRNKGFEDGRNRTNAICKSLMRLAPMRFKGKDCTGTFFKLDSRSVRIDLEHNIFAAEGMSIESGGQAFGQLAEFDKLGASTGNLFCWLGAGRNPHVLPRGFTTLIGDEARATWEAAVRDWWKTYPGRRLEFDPLP